MRNDSMTIILAKAAVSALAFWALLILAGIFSGGCVSRRVAPQTPESATLGRTAELAWGGPRARGPHLRNVEAWIEADTLVLRARVYGIGGMPWTAWIHFDTDLREVYCGRWDYVARFSEVGSDNLYPVRRASMVVESPITGFGQLQNYGHTIRTAIPLSALGNDDGAMKLRLYLVYGDNEGWCEIADLELTGGRP